MKKFRFRELKVPLSKKENVDSVLSKELQVPESSIKNIKVERYSLDSRKRGNPHYSFTVSFECNKNVAQKAGVIPFTELPENERDPLENTVEMSKNVHVVGAGPAGLWATYTLLRRGFHVTLHEQGEMVADRFRSIHRFFSSRIFNPHSNVLFGEGGAGAFSDGKLNTRSRNFFSQLVLEDMVSLGMPHDILVFAKPHLGTDRLALMLMELRKRIVSLGGILKFGSVFEDLEIQDGNVCKAKFNGEWVQTNSLVLATGHSARHIYELLHERGVCLESKGFAMGVRVEHLQSLINERQLGKNVDVRITGSAEYALTAKTIHETSAAYSFCMCPGGVLVPCASEPFTLATNGMSHSHRRGPYANGAIVVPIQKSDSLFGGLNFQRELETRAFLEGSKNYAAPAQTIEAFLENRKDISDLPKTTYPCGIVQSNLRSWLTSPIADSLAEGFLNFERKIPGFIKNGLMVAPETRTSSPVRIVRHADTMESVNVKGLFVLGEGAGYSGGIVTSAADGARLAYRAFAIHK